jgi:hypothetical protein
MPARIKSKRATGQTTEGRRHYPLTKDQIEIGENLN